MTLACRLAAGNEHDFLRCAHSAAHRTTDPPRHAATRSMSPPHALHNAVEMAFSPLIINRDDILEWIRCSLSRGGFPLLSWLRIATSSSARFGHRQAYLFERKIPYVIELSKCPRSF